MPYIVKWRERTGDSLRQQECPTKAEAMQWFNAVKAMGGVDAVVLPHAQARPLRPKRIQVIDPEGRVWNPDSETFENVEKIAAEINALLRK
jgi:hypothetical protein